MGGISFYRDRNGAEADLIIEYPSQQVALVEAKSANTASSSLFDSIGRVQKHLNTSTLAEVPSSLLTAVTNTSAGRGAAWFRGATSTNRRFKLVPVISTIDARWPNFVAATGALIFNRLIMQITRILGYWQI